MQASNRDWYAKPLAAATGATLTALTMTPFDVIKTRLQTQLPNASTTPTHQTPLFPKPPPNTCCQRSPADCIRNSHSLAPSVSHPQSSQLWGSRPNPTNPNPQVVCLWDGRAIRAQRVQGFWDAAWRVWTVEGVAGLWKGVGTTLAIAVPAQTAYMVTYDTLLTQVLPTHNLAPFAAGIMARTAVSATFSPLELLRTQLQASHHFHGTSRNLRSAILRIRTMVETQGVQSLWRGLSSTLWRDVPFSGFYWFSYETGKRALARRGYEGPGAAFVSGATSGSMAAILTSPFDVIKTRRQAFITTPSSTSSSTISIAARIVRTEGYRGLFAGLTPRLAKIAPACGIMISCYEVRWPGLRGLVLISLTISRIGFLQILIPVIPLNILTS
ncbi:hypothetical protein BS47DRAFT_1314239 [Hydnum rufescens UP504]|uniref:Mitochondrial carrier n=1 Tax=Hydnum rufescens UP504 TaxID=1448309 RepID=A0A9P6E003_9AGAM|nr:hypothetical protein BS47DRAFT_1314239 [Hydnum rufescens UP504]